MNKKKINKKVLLRERKRHTARRVAIAISCYPGGGGVGGPLTKIFFPVWTCIKPNLVSKFFPFTGGGSLNKNFFSSLNMYQAKSGVKNLSLYLGGGAVALDKKIFSGLNMYQAKSGVKNFPLYWGGGSLNKKFFFSSLNMYQAKSGVKNLSLYLGGGGSGPWQKFFFWSEHVSSQIWCQKLFPLLEGGRAGWPLTNFFFPVWTCIKPNLVSKIFPFTGGVAFDKNFFSGLNMYQAKSGVKNFPLYWGGGSLNKIFFSSLNMYQAKSGVKNFSLYWGGGWDGPWQKFFFQFEHVSSQIWCQKFFPLLGGGWPLTKIFFPVWTCIKPNLVSKIFPFTGGEGGMALDKNFFSSLNMYLAKSGVKNFSLYWGGGWPLTKIFFPVWTCIKPNLVSKNFPFTETGYPPPRTDTHLWKHNLPSYVRTRAVIITFYFFSVK